MMINQTVPTNGTTIPVMQRVDTGVDTERTQRRTLQHSSGNNLLDVDVGAITNTDQIKTTVASRAHCHLIGLLPMGPECIESGYVTGYEYALAMQLAVKHLNEGDGGVISALSGLNETCPISFSLSITDTHYDPSMAFQAVETLTESRENSKHGLKPSAFVGAFSSAVSKSTAVVTGMRGYPQVSYGSTSPDLSNKFDYPLFARTIPEDGFMAEALVRFFYETLGLRHLFVIAERDPFQMSVLKGLRDAVHRLGQSPGTVDGHGGDFLHVEERLIDSINYEENKTDYRDASIYEAIEALEASEFSFVLVLARKSLKYFTTIAHEHRFTENRTYHWWFYETSHLKTVRYEHDDPMAGVVNSFDSAGYITQTSMKQGIRYNQFVEDSEQLKRELYMGGHRGRETMTDTTASTSWLFDTYRNVSGPMMNESQWLVDGFTGEMALYAYDAVVMLGLSACREVAADTNNSSSESLVLTGTNWFERLRNTTFDGITGSVDLDPKTGTRRGHSVQYAIENLHAFEDSGMVGFRSNTTYVLRPGTGNVWENVNPHIFNGGLNITSLGSHPGLLPIDIVYTHTKASVMAITLGVLSIILLVTMYFVIWTYQNWNSRVVQASQPRLLLLLCLGIAITALEIVPIAIEHSNLHIARYDKVCISKMWFLFVGTGITTSTLFAKTYRINTIMDNSLRCKRIKHSLHETMYPVIIMLSSSVIILSLMTIFSPPKYEMVEIRVDRFCRTSEQYGRCDNQSFPFFFLIYILNTGMVFLVLIQAWRARHLSTEFAESKYIAHSLLIFLLAYLFTFLVKKVSENNPTMNIVMNTALVCTVTINPLCYIFIPKLIFQAKSNIPPSKRVTFVFKRMLDTIYGGGVTHASSLVVNPVLANVPSDSVAFSDCKSDEKIPLSKRRQELVSENQALEIDIAAQRAEIENLRDEVLTVEVLEIENDHLVEINNLQDDILTRRSFRSNELDVIDRDGSNRSAATILPDISYELNHNDYEWDAKSRTTDKSKMEDVSSSSFDIMEPCYELNFDCESSSSMDGVIFVPSISHSTRRRSWKGQRPSSSQRTSSSQLSLSMPNVHAPCHYP